MTAAISNVGEKKCRVVAGYLRMKDRERTSAKTFFLRRGIYPPQSQFTRFQCDFSKSHGTCCLVLTSLMISNTLHL